MSTLKKLNGIIVGGGVSGLSAALALSECCSIKLLAGKSNKILASPYYSSFNSNEFDPFVGIWTGGLESIESISKGVLNEMEENGIYIGRSLYSSYNGGILAEPSEPLRPFIEGGIGNLLYIRESKLLEILKSRLSRKVDVINENFEDIIDHNQSEVSIKISNGKVLNGHFLIGADGKGSSVRKKIFTNISKKPYLEPLSYNGYHIYRGFTPFISPRYEKISFQSWGNGIRFSCVNNIQNGSFWYATIKNNQPIVEGNGSQKVSHNSHRVSKSEKLVLLDKLSSWHSPVNELVQNTEKIYVNNAIGFSYLPSTYLGRALLIGDAGYCLDPILAQGIGLAFEDSNELRTVFEELTVDDSNEVPGAIAWLGQKRRNRASQINQMSKFVNKISQLEGTSAKFRDTMMKNAGSFSTFVFDSAIRKVANRGCSKNAGPH